VGLKAPAYRLYEDEFSVGILDINPFTPGHCLVISKRHTRWWHDLTDEETRGLFSAARLIGRMIMKGLHPKLVCMYTRGTRVLHTHVHLVPTYTGDLFDNFFNALEKIPDYQREMVRLDEKKLLKETAERIKEGLKHQKK
jgi:histidine triad (HIT) family protein